MCNILHDLELLRCIFHHQLEALGVSHSILLVDEIVDAARDAPPLVGWEDEHLRDLRSISVHTKMSLVHRKNGH